MAHDVVLVMVTPTLAYVSLVFEQSANKNGCRTVVLDQVTRCSTFVLGEDGILEL